MLVFLPAPIGFQLGNLLLEIHLLLLMKLKRIEFLHEVFFDDLFADAGNRATPVVAAIVGVAFLHLSNERVIAVFACEEPAEDEVVPPATSPGFSLKDIL